MIWDILSNDFVQYAGAAVAGFIALWANNIRQRKLGAKQNQQNQEARDNETAKDIRRRVSASKSDRLRNPPERKYRD